MLEFTFSGNESKTTADHLKNGEICKVTGVGNSMLPILKSRQAVICEPVTEGTILAKKDIVLCKVNGHHYLHLIHKIKKVKDKTMFLIGNNHGHMNGWVNKDSIYGRVVEILPM